MMSAWLWFNGLSKIWFQELVSMGTKLSNYLITDLTLIYG